MAKKNFTTGVHDILKSNKTPEHTIPDKKLIEGTNSTEIRRTTLLLDTESYFTIKAIAWYERRQIKDVIIKAIKILIDKYDVNELGKIKKLYQESNSDF